MGMSEPAALTCAQDVASGLQRAGLTIGESNGLLLADPKQFLNKSGAPYKVYTAFQRSLLRELQPQPLVRPPKTLRKPTHWPKPRKGETSGCCEISRSYLANRWLDVEPTVGSTSNHLNLF